MTLAWPANKPLTYRLLREHGLPTPRSRRVLPDGAWARPSSSSASSRADCVVKPAARHRRGPRGDHRHPLPAHLARAAAAAAVYGDELLIEEQMAGDNYRLLYLDGELLDAFVRRPPTVVADGRSTSRRLVRVANEARLRYGSGLSQVLLTVDLDMKRTLAKQGLSLRSTPAEGTVVTVKTVVNENCGADNTSATHLLCPAIVEAGARPPRPLGVRLAGIDLITRDPARPARGVGRGDPRSQHPAQLLLPLPQARRGVPGRRPRPGTAPARRPTPPGEWTQPRPGTALTSPTRSSP